MSLAQGLGNAIPVAWALFFVFFAALSECLLLIKSCVAIFAKLLVGAAVILRSALFASFKFVFDFGGPCPFGANFKRRLVLMVAMPN